MHNFWAMFMNPFIPLVVLLAAYAGDFISWKTFITFLLLGLTWMVLKDLDMLITLVRRDPFAEYEKMEEIENNIEEINNELTELKRLIKNNIAINCDVEKKLENLIKFPRDYTL